MAGPAGSTSPTETPGASESLLSDLLLPAAAEEAMGAAQEPVAPPLPERVASAESVAGTPARLLQSSELRARQVHAALWNQLNTANVLEQDALWPLQRRTTLMVAVHHLRGSPLGLQQMMLEMAELFHGLTAVATMMGDTMSDVVAGNSQAFAHGVPPALVDRLATLTPPVRTVLQLLARGQVQPVMHRLTLLEEMTDALYRLVPVWAQHFAQLAAGPPQGPEDMAAGRVTPWSSAMVVPLSAPDSLQAAMRTELTYRRIGALVTRVGDAIDARRSQGRLLPLQEAQALVPEEDWDMVHARGRWIHLNVRGVVYAAWPPCPPVTAPASEGEGAGGGDAPS